MNSQMNQNVAIACSTSGTRRMAQDSTLVVLRVERSADFRVVEELFREEGLPGLETPSVVPLAWIPTEEKPTNDSRHRSVEKPGISDNLAEKWL
jgi:hypothetical protein